MLSCTVWDSRNGEIVVIWYSVVFQENRNHCYLVLCGIPGTGKSLLSCTVWDFRNREIIVILSCVGFKDQGNHCYLELCGNRDYFYILYCVGFQE